MYAFIFTQINFGDGYPDKAPEVTCHTAIYHPNIDVYDYGVCLNILDDDWQPHFGIDDVIQGECHAATVYTVALATSSKQP